jgi:hypothetical protein
MSSDSSTLTDAWLRLWSPTINLPGSGGIGKFNYHPYTTWAAPTLFSGNEAVEQVVYRDVATPGKQLGRLTDVVLQLVDELTKLDSNIADSECVKKLTEMTTRIKSIKTTVEDNTVAATKELLDKLKATDVEGFNALMKEYANSVG